MVKSITQCQPGQTKTGKHDHSAITTYSLQEFRCGWWQGVQHKHTKRVSHGRAGGPEYTWAGTVKHHSAWLGKPRQAEMTIQPTPTHTLKDIGRGWWQGVQQKHTLSQP
jgi:hypothetical protein